MWPGPEDGSATVRPSTRCRSALQAFAARQGIARLRLVHEAGAAFVRGRSGKLRRIVALATRMHTDNFGHEVVNPVGDSAMHPITPRCARQAALRVLAHSRARRPLALPGTPIGACSGASNC